MKHGATHDAIDERSGILDEGLRRFKPIFYFNDPQAIDGLREEFHRWVDKYPELKSHWSKISLYFAEDGAVFEFLGGGEKNDFAYNQLFQNE